MRILAGFGGGLVAAPFTMRWAGVQTQEGLATVAHPSYVMVPADEATYYNGDTFPLKFNMWRKDYSSIARPTSGTIVVRNGDTAAVVATLTPDVDPSSTDTQLVLAQLWTPSAAGNYTVQLTVDIGTDSQVRSDRFQVQILA